MAERAYKEVVTEEMSQIRTMIVETVAKREALKKEMQAWYDAFPNQRFEKLKDLIITDSTLSQLDLHYKRLWDFHNAKSS